MSLNLCTILMRLGTALGSCSDLGMASLRAFFASFLLAAVSGEKMPLKIRDRIVNGISIIPRTMESEKSELETFENIKKAIRMKIQVLLRLSLLKIFGLLRAYTKYHIKKKIITPIAVPPAYIYKHYRI